jgi:hypothetical protein
MADQLAAHFGGERRDLPAGPAARVRCRQSAPLGTGQNGAAGPEAELVQWYVPHASGQRIALLTFSTPT